MYIKPSLYVYKHNYTGDIQASVHHTEGRITSCGPKRDINSRVIPHSAIIAESTVFQWLTLGPPTPLNHDLHPLFCNDCQ